MIRLALSSEATKTITNGAMREGDHPNNIAPLFNPKPHAGTDA